MKIILDAVEEKIKSLLLQYSKEFARTGHPQVTLRFTGGWVRDKLLGRPSHDIDVAIDKSTGEEFATGLHTFMVGENIDEIGVHKIAVNPEKSKHLETATTRICGLDVDFVNLRSEKYASDSRVPSTVSFGTPKEDAFRRDATLNALFYNLTTNSVEDFTGRGLNDLKNGILRTPLDPLETFRDDPLRVLRLLRFVGQLGFSIAPDTYEAMHSRYVGSLLLTKISGERIGTEITKLVQSPYATLGLEHLLNLGLGPHIFYSPSLDSKSEDFSIQNDQAKHRFKGMKWLTSSHPLADLDKESKGILWLSSLLQDAKSEGAAMILSNGLKMTRIVRDGCSKLVESVSHFDNLVTLNEEPGIRRVDLGRFVRKCGRYWRICLLFNAARLESDELDPSIAFHIIETIENNQLENAYELKPLVAGKQLISLLNCKPGPQIAELLNSEIDFQLEHPQATAEDVKQWLLGTHEP